MKANVGRTFDKVEAVDVSAKVALLYEVGMATDIASQSDA